MAECPECSSSLVESARYCHVCGTSLVTTSAQVLKSSDPLVGRVIADRYRIRGLIGRGGMGVVYQGEHVHMGKTVAIKLLHGELAENRDLVKRFKREAEAISKLSNIHTVTIFDYGRSQGLIYLVMEFLAGRDVGWHVRKEGRMPLMRACMILVQACDSLGEAHAQGVIHRDLKPENVFLLDREDMKDFVKVLDFGLAKIKPEVRKPDDTAHGAVLGTPYYMPPEQIKGENVDHRADIYAMGGLLHCLLTGHPPFRAPTALAVMAAHLTQPPPPIEDETLEPEVREAVNPVIARCLSKDPDRRYQSASELKADLLSVIERFYVTGHTPITGLPEGFGKAALEGGGSAALEPARIKEEFERFERRLRVRRVAFILLPVLLAICAACAALLLLRGRDGAPASGDLEPNDTPSEASPLVPGVPVTGTIGRRLSMTESDHDWYVLDVAGESLVHVHLRRLRNVDLMLQLFSAGSEKSIASSSWGGSGEDEGFSGIRLAPGRYYLLVRQDLSKRGRPVEVISDSYRLAVTLLDPAGWEVEPNDTVETAVGMTVGGSMQGYVQSPGDRDVYCLTGPATGGLTVRLEPPEKLAVRLFTVDLETGTWIPHAAPRGEAVEIHAPASGSGTGLCLQVGAQGEAWSIRSPYRLTVE